MSRASRPRLLAVAAAFLAVILAACGSTAATASPSAAPSTAPSVAPTATPAPSPSVAAVAQLLEVHGEGGFINPAATIGSLSTIVVDSDGRIYTPGTPSDGSTPLVAPVDVRDVGAGGAAQILAAMKAAGLDKEASGGVVADAGSTVFTAEINGAAVVSRFAAGGGPGPVNHGGGGTGGDSGGPGAAAFALLAQLMDPTVTWGAASAPVATFAPTAYRVYTAPGAPADSGTGGSPVAWPLATGLADFGAAAAANFGVDGLRTGIVSGADATTLVTALKGASPTTAITSGGKSYTIWVRPVLPDELGS